MHSAMILFVIVLAIFRFFPNVAAGWLSAVISSIVTTAALLVGTQLTAMYLENFSGVSLAGAASALLGLPGSTSKPRSCLQVPN